jgi:hypothetical protein
MVHEVCLVRAAFLWLMAESWGSCHMHEQNSKERCLLSLWKV